MIGRPNTKKLRYKRRFIISTGKLFFYSIKRFCCDLEKGQVNFPKNLKTKIFTIEDAYLRNEDSDGLIRIRKSVIN
jgi:hypothetical protein